MRRQPRTQWNTSEPWFLVYAAIKAFAIPIGDVDQFRQRGHGALDVFDLLRNDLQLIRGEILRQHDAVAVIDQASCRGDDAHAHAVVVRPRRVDIVVDNLQLQQTADQHQCQRDHAQAGDHGAEKRELAFCQRILQ